MSKRPQLMEKRPPKKETKHQNNNNSDFLSSLYWTREPKNTNSSVFIKLAKVVIITCSFII